MLPSLSNNRPDADRSVVMPSGHRLSPTMAARIREHLKSERVSGGPKANAERTHAPRCDKCIHIGKDERELETMGVTYKVRTGMPRCGFGGTCLEQRGAKGRCGIAGKLYEAVPAFDPATPEPPVPAEVEARKEAEAEARKRVKVPVKVHRKEDFAAEGREFPG